LRLPCSIGLSTNKMGAKIASSVGKKRKARYFPLRYPNTLELVPPGGEADYLAPLPIEVIWGIGSRSAPRLHALGIRRIEELRALSKFTLQREFGASGLGFWQRARGIDDSPLITEPSPSKSVGRGRTFPHDLRQERDLREQLRLLGLDVMKRLRGDELRGRVVSLSLRWSDFTSCQRQRRLPALCDDPDIFLAVAQQLFTELWQPGRPVRMLTVRMAACLPKQPLSWAGTLWDSGEGEGPQERDEGRDDRLQRRMMVGGGTACFHHLV
jgi:DNA polymerase-4